MLPTLYLEHLDTHPLYSLQQHPPLLLTWTHVEGHIGRTSAIGVLNFLESSLSTYCTVMLDRQLVTVHKDYAGTWIRD